MKKKLSAHQTRNLFQVLKEKAVSAMLSIQVNLSSIRTNNFYDLLIQ